jgi:general secretion pathway protein E
MAQRLVRTLCTECRLATPPTESERRLLGIEPDAAVTVYHARGCSACNGSGYRGRTGIYELIPVDEHLQAMIHTGESEQALERYARTLSPGIRDDGLRKVLDGVSTLEEVVRVTRDD